MKIQVLGTGCPKCKKTAEIMKEAATKMGLAEGADYFLEKIETIPEIMKFGITMTPGVAIDGKVITSGHIPSIARGDHHNHQPSEPGGVMNQRQFILFGFVIIFTLTLIASCNSGNSSTSKDSKAAQVVTTADNASKTTIETKSEGRLPKMLDLGSKSCIPCKAMAPILDSLRGEYRGRADIEFIDTRENRKAAADHKITLIPTQIFFDANGVEKFRHVGFYPADSIVTHLKELGVK